jgi:hypothetical protein
MIRIVPQQSLFSTKFLEYISSPVHFSSLARSLGIDFKVSTHIPFEFYVNNKQNPDSADANANIHQRKGYSTGRHATDIAPSSELGGESLLEQRVVVIAFRVIQNNQLIII